jgi:hypothetical protein
MASSVVSSNASSSVAAEAHSRLPRRRRRQRLARKALDLLDRIHVRTLKLEYAVHAGMRGDARELRLHALEQRPRDFRVQVTDERAVARHRAGVGDDEARHRIGEHVAARAIEELERKCDVGGIDVFDLREVRDIGRALRVAGGDGREMAPSRQLRIASSVMALIA